MRRQMTIRRATPKVTHGRVQRKNRTSLSAPSHPFPPIVRKAAPRGHTHVVTRADVTKFLRLLPEWSDLIARLQKIVLAQHARGYDATYNYDHGIIQLATWKEFDVIWSASHVEEHRRILTRLRVPMEERDDEVVCRFTRDTARAFTLLHVLMHELGHHGHWTQRRLWERTEAEKTAEAFALRWESLVWTRYIEVFGVPDYA